MQNEYLLNGFVRDVIVDSEKELAQLAESKIVITGASGFIGSWLSNVLHAANLEFSLNMSLLFLTGKSNTILSSFQENSSHWKSIDFEKSPVELEFGYTHAIHCSTPSNFNSGSSNPATVEKVSTNSLRALLKDAINSKNTPTLLHLSSGGVYKGSHDYKHYGLSERSLLRENLMGSSYNSTKLKLESAVNQANAEGYIKGSNPRLFAFYGPRLPIDAHFAIGNFMRDALTRKSIKILGNPETIRSYMYPTDLLNALLKILVDPNLSAINIGSKQPRTLLDTAIDVSKMFDNCPIEVVDNNEPASSYYPLTDYLETRYDFKERISFSDGLEKWREWLEIQPGA
jgi:nucleoside-diphosphate-sugar epimerase